MAYKGDDLELRTTQSNLGIGASAWTPQPFEKAENSGPLLSNGARLRSRPQGGRSSALIVDDMVLACANSAYDVASVYGAREVMLEHLLHAMTRVPDAAQILDSRGIHVASLRRETAAVIANDIPGASGPTTALRTSNDFDAVMHLAAANARLKGDRPASIRDLLFVLINYDRDAPGVELLRRYWPNWQQDQAGERVDEGRHSTIGRSATARDPRNVQYDLPIPPVADRPLDRGDFLENGAAPAVEGRLQSVERGLNMLASEASRERKVLGDLAATLQETVLAQRADQQGLRGALSDRLGRLEKSIEAIRYDGGNAVGQASLESMLNARLQRFEKMQETLLTQRPVGANLEAALGDRLARLEKAIEATRIDASKLPNGVSDRLQQFERSVENKLAELSRTWGVLGDRLGRLEKTLETLGNAMPAGLVDRIGVMERSVETKIGEGVRSWSGIGERLSIVERSIAAQRAEVAHIQAAISTELKTIEKAVSAMPNGAGAVNERFEALERALGQHRNEILNKIPDAVSERLQGIAQLVESRLNENGRGTAGQSDRIAALEKTIVGMRTEATELGKLRDGEILEVRTILNRFAGAQQTLAGAVDQWRLDNTGDLGIISNRLEAIEHANVRPMEMLESIATRMQSLTQNSGLDRKPGLRSDTPRRRGFWRWLFGLH